MEGNLDSTDRKILRELQENGRLTNQELAARVNLSPSPCLRRVRLLEQRGVIQGYTAIVDHHKYGLPIDVFVQVRLERHSEDAVKVFEAQVQDIDEILDCYVMTGTTDYLLHIVSDSLQSYERLMRQRLHKIPGIAAIETSFAFGRVKRKKTFPPLHRAEPAAGHRPS
ncbi:MAG: Lrp/AsnC family transcriptional regulator [Hyphomicrobiales bacterium]|nr:Lrp/AsnC family transcriptional regulator [Hyphomicrobiales bacterium]MCP5370369.1 Lrp/AsnC family transcriptional regulator [Hyphomicrobiales bacterium]